MLHERHCPLLITLLVIMELHEYHPLAGVGIAHHHVAQESNLLAQVEERHAAADGEIAYGVANLVLQVVHEVTFLYR